MKEPAEPGGKARDVTPQEFAVRSLAQEYGGGAFAVQGDVVVFSNYNDQRLYKQTIGGKELNLRLTATIPHFLLPGTLTITPQSPIILRSLVLYSCHYWPPNSNYTCHSVTPSFKPRMRSVLKLCNSERLCPLFMCYENAKWRRRCQEAKHGACFVYKRGNVNHMHC